MAPKPKIFTLWLLTESACQACSRAIVSDAPRMHCGLFASGFRNVLSDRAITKELGHITLVVAVLAPHVWRRLVEPPLGFGPWSVWPHGTTHSGTQQEAPDASRWRTARRTRFLSEQACSKADVLPHYLPVILVETSILPIQSPQG